MSRRKSSPQLTAIEMPGLAPLARFSANLCGNVRARLQLTLRIRRAVPLEPAINSPLVHPKERRAAGGLRSAATPTLSTPSQALRCLHFTRQLFRRTHASAPTMPNIIEKGSAA